MNLVGNWVTLKDGVKVLEVCSSVGMILKLGGRKGAIEGALQSARTKIFSSGFI